MLLVLNACHGGTIAPARLDAAEVAATALTTSNPPEDTVAALLGTGTQRIVIAACRAGQRSHTGSGPLSIFGQALVDGLRRIGVSLPIDADQARMGARDIFFDYGKTWRELGEPRIDMRQSLRDTYQWYLDNGYIKEDVISKTLGWIGAYLPRG